VFKLPLVINLKQNVNAALKASEKAIGAEALSILSGMLQPSWWGRSEIIQDGPLVPRRRYKSLPRGPCGIFMSQTSPVFCSVFSVRCLDGESQANEVKFTRVASSGRL